MTNRQTANKKAALSKLKKPTNAANKPKPLIERKLSASLKGRKAVFAGKFFVMSGEFPNPHAVMEGWITYHGGRVDKVVTDETTHLVCTMDNFKSKVSDVRNAWRLGKARCKIVDWEYLEDSVWPKPKHISEDTYQLEKMLAGRKRKRIVTARQKINRGKGSQALKEVIDPPCHHVYVDNTGFQFKIVLHRTTSPTNSKPFTESLTIYIFESNATPPSTYLLAMKHKKGILPAVLHRDKDVGKAFQKAFEEFKSLFEEKTAVKWDQRLQKPKHNEGAYTYLPPTGGKPVGVLSLGWKKRDEVLERDSCSIDPISDGTTGEDCLAVDHDLADDTDSGDDTN